MTWTPSDALVEKAARAVADCDCHENIKSWHLIYARAALLAARDDMVAEAVRAEAEACAAIADVGLPFDTNKHVTFRDGCRCASQVISAAIRARHP